MEQDIGPMSWDHFIAHESQDKSYTVVCLFHLINTQFIKASAVSTKTVAYPFGMAISKKRAASSFARERGLPPYP